MKTRILIAAAVTATVGFIGSALAADVAAGKTKVDALCIDCHEDGKADEYFPHHYWMLQFLEQKVFCLQLQVVMI